MKNLTVSKGTLLGVLTVLFIAISYAGQPINDYYKKHKNDVGMEAKVVPPKLASLFIDEDYPEAIDLLQSMTSLKYLNFYGAKSVIAEYAKNAISAKGAYQSILEDVDGNREVSVFGVKRNGKVKKVIAVVQTKTQFLLLIGKGNLSKAQVASLPALSKEIQ